MCIFEGVLGSRKADEGVLREKKGEGRGTRDVGESGVGRREREG